jgi:citrate lyase beta subunit
MSLDVQSLVSAFRRRRHVLYAPGSELTKLSKANLLRELDTAVFDLEDGVPPARKDLTRQTIVSYLATKPTIYPECAVRINSISRKSTQCHRRRRPFAPTAGD